jgi:hypothetical protein
MEVQYVCYTLYLPPFEREVNHIVVRKPDVNGFEYFEPRRTCEELGSVRVWQECDVWSHELSCGHEVDTLDMEPPKFCPECGAKVVSE